MLQTWSHAPVLLPEAIDALVVDPGGHFVDATFGRGGHAREILRRLGPAGRLTAFDRDPQACAAAKAIDDPRFCIRQCNFTELAALAECSLAGILMDLGVSSPQIDDPQRGFSFRGDGPLDMRMDPAHGVSAGQWLAAATEREIAGVIRDYGEERFARAIAKAIVAGRGRGEGIRTTHELARIVAGAVRRREPGKDPATRTFQAIRIFVNDELGALRQALEASPRVLRSGGRLVVISFHSLEDRIVKRFMRDHSRAKVDRRVPFAEPAPMPLRVLARVRPGPAERAANPRSRSAVMRVAERTEVPCR